MIERATAAHRAGLDSLFVGDQHVSATPYYQNTPMLGRLLAEWGKAPAGCLFLLPLWHPVLVAEQIGTLAAIAQGPFIMQCGLGWGDARFAAMGATIRTRRRARTVRRCRLHCAVQFFESHLGCPRRRRPAVPRGNDRALFLYRLWRGIPRDAPVRRHVRSVRRDIPPRRLDLELRDLWPRLPSRCCRHHFPVPEHLATVISPRVRPEQAQPSVLPSASAHKKCAQAEASRFRKHADGR
jgi:hypothetical protein